MSAARTPMSSTESPSPNSAIASGSPTATIEPNAISRMIAAAIRPTNSGLPPPWASRIGGPPSSILSPLPLAASAIPINVLPVSVGTSSAGRSSSRRVSAIVPSGDTRGAPARATPSRRSARSSTRSTRASTAGSRAPASACQTTWIVSPEVPGKRSAIRSAAACDSDPAVSNSAENSPARRGATAAVAARTTIQASSMRPRRR